MSGYKVRGQGQVTDICISQGRDTLSFQGSRSGEGFKYRVWLGLWYVLEMSLSF